MRSRARAGVLLVLSVVVVMVLGVASAFMSAVALGATALIVPGTGTPDPEVENYKQHAWDRYIKGVACTDAQECEDPVLTGIPYPASFWPMSIFPDWCVPGRCEKWDVSVGEGVAHLKEALLPLLAPSSTEDVFIFGYSQGGAVVANTLQYLGELGLSEKVKERLQVVTIGGIENPDGGLWQRLAWLRYLLGSPVPVLDLTFEPAMPVDLGIRTTAIGFEYDPVTYAPRFWGNPFAMLNAFAAFDTVHGYYLSPDGDDAPDVTMPYGYTAETLAPQLDCSLNQSNCRTDKFGNTYIIIPATSLPLTDLVRSWADDARIGWLLEPFIDLVEPVLREAVDLGYDWTGDPGVPRSLSVLPFKLFQNWIKVGIDFAVAAIKGVEAFLGNFVPRESEVETLDPPAETDQAPATEEVEDRVAPSRRAEVTATEEAVTAATEETVTTEDTVTEEEAVLVEDIVEDVAENDDTAAEEPEPTEDATPTLRERNPETSGDGFRTKRTRAAA